MLNQAAAKLRAQLADKDALLVCPGVQDGLSARVCLEQGFQNLYMTGAGTSISTLGLPDLGLATADDMHRNAAMLASLDRTVPLIADADTGYGGALMVARTIERYAAAGIAGAHIEDQALTKRCGHLAGKELVSREEFTTRIRAATAARKAMGSDFVVIARTDALQKLGFDEAIARLKEAVAAGADAVFLEGMTTREQVVESARVLAPLAPCLLNMVNGGVTPLVTKEEAREMGYRVVIWPCFAMTAALLAYRAAAKELRETGMIAEKRDEEGKVMGGVRECFEVCGLSKFAEWDKQMGGATYKNGV